MAVTRLWLTDFRCFAEAAVEPDPTGLTVLRGPNGAGKTSVLEAVGWLSRQRSIRGAPREALVRNGARRAVVRAECVAGGRLVLIEAEIPEAGSLRTQVNRQVVRRRVELAEALRTTVFSPDDLALVQGGPAGRRDYLDDALIDAHPRHETLVADAERILRQRGALLRQAGGRAQPEVLSTLDVWDERLAAAGDALALAREALVEELGPAVAGAYAHLAGVGDRVTMRYRRSWAGPLAAALAACRAEDLRRGASTVGPHRDELELSVDGRPARTHASQGEQRCVALALRLATHAAATARSPEAPTLLLDDVFSELDPRRAAALVEQLPPGQVLLTTAVDPPPVVAADRVVEVADGTLVGAGGAR
ncbi:MAG TPA: DNA replication and repair protein RecF [Acidimicrobiales bacterium]|nr:DNA replication and repair protein RecF [Acidimicrobiales bacterium]